VAGISPNLLVKRREEHMLRYLQTPLKQKYMSKIILNILGFLGDLLYEHLYAYIADLIFSEIIM